MIIGIPKERKNGEYRVGATPDMVKAFTTDGHIVLVETQAGQQIGLTDEMYISAGALIVKTPADVYTAEMIIKVKEPQVSEFPLMREGQILFGYLHLAADPEQSKGLIERKVVGIAYETVEDKYGRLPLVVPMSEIAGRSAILAGATGLQIANGGKGVLLGGVPGVAPGKVVIIGGGIVGMQAAITALGLGADVTILDNNLTRLRELDALYGPALKTHYSSPSSIERAVIQADLVIGAVHIPGKKAPKIITREMVKKMQKGAVIVDVAIDQGGCSETSYPMTHSEPTYIDEGVVHYCVANMPGACAKTATQALTNATMPYALKIANLGYKKALQEDMGFLLGLNTYLGRVTNRSVAQDLGFEFSPPESLFERTATLCGC